MRAYRHIGLGQWPQARTAVLGLAIWAALVPVLAPLPAAAEGRLDAQYTVTLAGIAIGKGSWTIDVADTHYSAAVNGAATGVMRLLTKGAGNSSARGTLNGGRPLSSIYAATIQSRGKTDEIRVTIANGNVKDFKVEPPQDDAPDRVPITDAHRKAVLDPMTALMIRMPGNGDPVAAEACNQNLAIFDGRLRYDLQLAFKRIDQVKAENGYAGPVAVCAVAFKPLAGYIPTRAAIKYMSESRDIEVWLAPIAGTRVLVPFRVQGPSPVGRVVMEAHQFVSVATSTKAAINAPKAE